MTYTSFGDESGRLRQYRPGSRKEMEWVRGQRFVDPSLDISNDPYRKKHGGYGPPIPDRMRYMPSTEPIQREGLAEPDLIPKLSRSQKRMVDANMRRMKYQRPRDMMEPGMVRGVESRPNMRAPSNPIGKAPNEMPGFLKYDPSRINQMGANSVVNDPMFWKYMSGLSPDARKAYLGALNQRVLMELHIAGLQGIRF